VNKIITKSVEPPVGTTILQLRNNSVTFGITAYASITSTKTSFWTPVYISQGLEISTGLTVGYHNPIIATFTVDVANGNAVTFGPIECYNGITTYGYITCNALVATNIYTKTETDNLLATQQHKITTSTYLAVSSLTAQSYVSSPSLRATDIDFLGTTLTIKSGSTYFTSMSASTGIKHYTYQDFNNNYIYNVNEITGINNIIGSGICAAARGSYNYRQVSGGTYLRPTAPNNQGVYIGNVRSTS